ncbi:MAG: hypothetical protein M1814_001502 [Vezdaea aestivalis]|nr:MAG: hypothetical protein M1814_001502 [Vezdaea aestivalis]
MSTLERLRERILTEKVNAAGQSSRTFLPDTSLRQILEETDVPNVLRHPPFSIESHKISSTVSFVTKKGSKIFAILTELNLGRSLVRFIAHDIHNDSLAVENIETLKTILDFDTISFTKCQWDYLAVKLSKRVYQWILKPNSILPYVSQKMIGSGGFSNVYIVSVHPAHQDIDPGSQGKELRLVRKEVKDSILNSDHESELLFLIGSIEHRNISKILAAYVLNDTWSLLFWPAEMDLHAFLQETTRAAGFEDDRSIIKAIQGLASGLSHLHYFKLDSVQGIKNTISMIGVHHDLKPRNILVKGPDFMLADFGLSRLKPASDDSKSWWRNATYEYGAPDCRHPLTWEQRKIGRSSDIWSLGCIISELMIYICQGASAVLRFRENRVTDGPYGKQGAFHDGKQSKGQIVRDMERVEREASSAPISNIFRLVKQTLTENPSNRPDARATVLRLEHISLQYLWQDLLDAWSNFSKGDVEVYIRLEMQIETVRLQTWAKAVGLESQDYSATSDQPIDGTDPDFSTLSDKLERLLSNLNALQRSGLNANNRNLACAILDQFNNEAYGNLRQDLKKKANNLFKIHCTFDFHSDDLSSMGQHTAVGSQVIEDARKTAAIRYLSSLGSQIPEFTHGSHILRMSLLESQHVIDPRAHPRTFLYPDGNANMQKKRIIVEWRDYGTDPNEETNHEPLENHVKTMLRQYFGTLEDLPNLRYGIACLLSDDSSTPVRLHYLLKRGGCQGQHPPHLGQKFLLARRLAACLLDVHLSGWVHKNISTHNILLFQSSEPWVEIRYGMPYLIGFEHSRENETNAYSIRRSDSIKEYQHPQYRDDPSSFYREFDYYSLGLVLLEIGTWESLSAIYLSAKGVKLSHWGLRDEYVKLCAERILERMGPIYSEVILKCLHWEPQADAKEEDAAVEFQTQIIENLESCIV